jgi:hypothetical protein
VFVSYATGYVQKCCGPLRTGPLFPHHSGTGSITEHTALDFGWHAASLYAVYSRQVGIATAIVAGTRDASAGCRKRVCAGSLQIES